MIFLNDFSCRPGGHCRSCGGFVLQGRLDADGVAQHQDLRTGVPLHPVRLGNVVRPVERVQSPVPARIHRPRNRTPQTPANQGQQPFNFHLSRPHSILAYLSHISTLTLSPPRHNYPTGSLYRCWVYISTLTFSRPLYGVIWGFRFHNCDLSPRTPQNYQVDHLTHKFIDL